MLDQERRGLGHVPAHARGADAAALAGERDAQAVAAAGALRHQEAVLEVSAGDERFELVPHEPRQRAGALLEPLAERRPVLAHQGEGVAVLGGPRNVARLGVTAGHCTALPMRVPGRSRRAVFSRRCAAHGSPGVPRAGHRTTSVATARQLGSSAARQLGSSARAAVGNGFRRREYPAPLVARHNVVWRPSPFPCTLVAAMKPSGTT